MAPTNQLAYLYTDIQGLQNVLSIEGLTARVDDTNNGAPLSPIESSYITSAIIYGTSRVNLYLLSRYDAIQLAQSWIAYDFASYAAIMWLGARRGNPIPGSLKTHYEDCVEEMKLIRAGTAELPDCATRNAAYPAFSNSRLVLWGNLRKVRVERPISSDYTGGDPAGVPPFQQFADPIAEYLWDWYSPC